MVVGRGGHRVYLLFHLDWKSRGTFLFSFCMCNSLLLVLFHIKSLGVILIPLHNFQVNQIVTGYLYTPCALTTPSRFPLLPIGGPLDSLCLPHPFSSNNHHPRCLCPSVWFCLFCQFLFSFLLDIPQGVKSQDFRPSLSNLFHEA